MKFKKRNNKRIGMDITPLIDVIFLLLIFFMVSTTFITSPGIHVNLPEASVKAKTDKPESLEVVITDKSQIFLNGKAIRKNKLKAHLATARKNTGFDKLIIRADGKVKHEEVVFIMDMANQAGLHKLSIATKMKDRK
jgi:biopolymer transport protein ExbD